MSGIGKVVSGFVIAIAAVFATPFIGPQAAAALIKIGSALVVSGLVGSVVSLFTPKPHTGKEISKINVRISEPTRWLSAGEDVLGGAVLFGEFDDDANLWYVIVHGDSILTNPDTCTYYFDSRPISIDPTTREVLTADYRLTAKKDVVTTDGDGDPYFYVWTTTYDETDPTPPAVTALATAFPTKWDSTHKLVGTTYSVVKVKAIDLNNRYKIFKWRGPLQLGDPSVSVLGQWSNVYDPRDGSQTNGTPTTYKFTRNPVLIWAWFRTHPYGRNKPRASINWDKCAEQAAICDQTVSGLVGTHVRYQCATAIPEDQERAAAEQDILMSMDAQLVFDDDGTCWPRVGYYETPTLALSRNRDIVAMASIEAINGESETQGVIVRYTEPDAGYTTQPSAPWYNPLYYVPGTAAKFLTVDILTCQDHNQAMRLGKAIGMRSQPIHRLAPTASLRGLKARKERFFDLSYDDTFTGDYEIVTPVSINNEGIFCNFAAVPVDADRWTLLAGEEKPKPVINDIDTIAAPSLPTGVTLSAIDGRIQASFTAPTRSDVGYQFQYILTDDIATDNWVDMQVDMVTLKAYSGAISDATEYSIQYRSVAGSGLASVWSSPPLTFTNTTPLPPVQAGSFIVTGGVGANTIQWQNPADLRFNYTQLRRGTTNVLGASTVIATTPGAPGQVQGITDTLTLGTYYYWITCFVSGGGTSSTTTGPVSGTVI